jgi:LPS sulfotransferase NodH
VKFVIVSAPRTGSTLLAQTLNNTPGVVCHGELLLSGQVRGYRDGFDPFTATAEQRKARSTRLLQARDTDSREFVKTAMKRPAKAVGMKVIYNDLLQTRWRDALQWLLDTPDLHWIHLQRRNLLRRYVSERVMHAGGAIHSAMGGRAKRRVQVEIDINDFQARCAQLEAERQHVVQLIGDRPLMDVFYEELSSETGTVVAGVCQMLGLETLPESITPALKKVGTDDLAQSVSNYNQLLDNELTRHWTQSR